MQKRRTLRKIIIIILILVAMLWTSKQVWATYMTMASDGRVITFSDDNLYRAVKSKLGSSAISDDLKKH